MTHPTDDSLKPCPFCGGAASLHPRTCDKNTPYNPADRAFPVARCGQCGAEALGKDWGKPETAAEKWNARALLAEQARTEPTQEFESAQGRALASAWAEGWAQCRDAEYVGEEAESEAFNQSATLAQCLYADQTRFQGGLSNDQLRRAWSAKLPNVIPTDEQLTAFALGIEAAAQPLKAEQAKDAAEDARMTTAARDVLAERQRQVSAEGWTPEHDDEHRSGDMARAAASYAAQAVAHVKAECGDDCGDPDWVKEVNHDMPVTRADVDEGEAVTPESMTTAGDLAREEIAAGKVPPFTVCFDGGY